MLGLQLNQVSKRGAWRRNQVLVSIVATDDLMPKNHDTNKQNTDVDIINEDMTSHCVTHRAAIGKVTIRTDLDHAVNVHTATSAQRNGWYVTSGRVVRLTVHMTPSVRSVHQRLIGCGATVKVIKQRHNVIM